MSSPEVEKRNAFDNFSLWNLVRNVDTAATVNLMQCDSIQPILGNYMLAVIVDRESGSTQYILLEHYFTKRSFEEVTQEARKESLCIISSFLNIPHNAAFDHYLHITNECPAVHIDQPGLKLLKTADMLVNNQVSAISSKVLGVISAAPQMNDAQARNVYDICFSNEKSIRDELKHATKALHCATMNDGAPSKPLHSLEAQPMNSIKLSDLASDLHESSNAGQPAPLGLFLVRKGRLLDIQRYIKRNCVDRLEDLKDDTWFLVSDTVPFDEPFPNHVCVHEVITQQDYGIVLWQRSRGSSGVPIGKYFSNIFWDFYDAAPSAPAWLNVLVSNETDGSTSYIQELVSSTRKADPFRMVAFLQAVDMMEVLQQRQNTSSIHKLCAFFNAHTNAEKFAVTHSRLLLVVDHAFEDNGMGFSTQLLADFLNAIETHQRHRLQIWIVGNDRLWECLVTSCNYAINKYAMPNIKETEHKEWLSFLLQNEEECRDIESIFNHVHKDNPDNNGVTEKVFYFAALSQFIKQENEEASGSYWWVDVIERFVWKNVASEGSVLLQELEQECYNRVVSSPETFMPLSSAQGAVIHRTVMKFLAAKYLVQHPHMIDVEKYRLFESRWLDPLLFRHNPVAMAVVKDDIDTVRRLQMDSPDALRTASDCLQRNILHIAHHSEKMRQMLLAAEIDMEKRCCSQLNSWTPLQMADDRADWPLVDKLIGHGAVVPKLGLRLHTMTLPKLKVVFSDCIGYGCSRILLWICQHRPDYLISQEDVYSMVVVTQELGEELLFRLLEHGVGQGLPDREPEPYKFIWDNTALDLAVEDDRYEVAAFLVERLHFQPTESFFGMQKNHEDQADFKHYTMLYKLCCEGNMEEVVKLIEQKQLDPMHDYDGTNLFIQAAGSGNAALVKVLFDLYGFKERVSEEDKDGNSAMSMAMQRGCEDTVRLLHECGAAVNPALARTYPGCLPNDAVAIDTEDFQSLVSLERDRLEQLDINYCRLEEGELFIHYYIWLMDEPDERTFRYLVAQYADVDVRTETDQRGQTPLHVALECGNERCAEILLQCGATVHAKTLFDGASSLHCAIVGNVSKRIITRLIEVYGIDVNTRDANGRSIAFRCPPNRRFCQWIVDRHGLDMNARDHSGQTILHYRVQQRNHFLGREIEFLLRELHIPQGLTDKRGRLALHYAVEAGELETVRLLLKYRTDLVDVPDGEGLTSRAIACRGAKHASVRALLESIP